MAQTSTSMHAHKHWREIITRKKKEKKNGSETERKKEIKKINKARRPSFQRREAIRYLGKEWNKEIVNPSLPRKSEVKLERRLGWGGVGGWGEGVERREERTPARRITRKRKRHKQTEISSLHRRK